MLMYLTELNISMFMDGRKTLNGDLFKNVAVWLAASTMRLLQ